MGIIVVARQERELVKEEVGFDDGFMILSITPNSNPFF